MFALGSVVLLVYAVLMIAGGFIGYRVAGSRASLISGTISGLLLLGAFVWSRFSPNSGGIVSSRLYSNGPFVAGAIIALLLSVVFAMRLAKTHRFMPSGMMLAVSILALVLLALAALRPS